MRALLAEAGFRSVSQPTVVLGNRYPELAVSRASLSRPLGGKRPGPNVHLMYAGSRELGVTLDHLYELVTPLRSEVRMHLNGGRTGSDAARE